MEIKYVAFDSFGVKSSCIFLETKDVAICIDPGVAAETDSFPLPFLTRQALKMKYKQAIKKACREADVIVITHYHYDHHIPEANLYKGKHLLIKDPIRNINKSQRERAAYFLELVKKKAKKIEIADGKEFKFGDTRVKFSKAVWHGPAGTNLGKVIMVTVKDSEEKVLHSSDIDGPYIRDYAKTIVKEKPELIILDGFPSYLLGFLASIENLRRVIRNTIYILENTHAKIILDHHLLRDYRYREIYYEVYKRADELDREVHTAAEEIGKEPEVIKGYKKYGLTRWKTWPKFTFEYLEKSIRRARKIKAEKEKQNG
jgi:hypothetical protein